MQAGLERLVGHLTGASVAATTTIFERWAELVGDPVASHTTPRNVKEGVLTVAVDDPAWASQLRFLEADLLATLRAEPGGERLTGIVFTVRRDG
jgi:predicted nucleic acid-binding Zn ribbon protein